MNPIACPVLAVCGWSGSGKTTLIEAVLPLLVARGLRVAVLKHDAHGIHVDRPGKDSDRLFRAGGDVVLQGPDEVLERRHQRVGDVHALVARLSAEHDLVLVEGHKGTPLEKVWLASADSADAPGEVQGVRAVLARGEQRPVAFLDLLDGWYPEAWRARPLVGAVLYGGLATRMGSPRHLVEHDGVTFIERVVAALDTRVAPVFLLGHDDVPASLASRARLPDPPGSAGPLGAVVGALRWARGSGLVVAGCDQVRLDARAIDWLLAQRRPGSWAVIPRDAHGHLEPLGALYEPQSLGLLESLAASERASFQPLAGDRRIASPPLPLEMEPLWRSVNTPGELREPGAS